MEEDQLIPLFIGLLLLIGGAGLLFIGKPERAEELDRKRGLAAPDLPRTHVFSPYFLFQSRWYRWVAAGSFFLLAAIFIGHAFGLLNWFLF